LRAQKRGFEAKRRRLPEHDAGASQLRRLQQRGGGAGDLSWMDWMQRSKRRGGRIEWGNHASMGIYSTEQLAEFLHIAANIVLKLNYN
jgi:hypothetical protein